MIKGGKKNMFLFLCCFLFFLTSGGGVRPSPNYNHLRNGCALLFYQGSIKMPESCDRCGRIIKISVM